ncbi:MAG: DUF1700 domain-containing protein [Lachnotalea sp.]
MNKYEFLNTLKETLESEVAQSVLNENINYYSNYIDEEMSKGKSEIEVLHQLGEPRLIAKTIIDTNSVEKNNGTYTYSNENQEASNDEPNRKGFHANYDDKNGLDFRFGNIKLNTWYGKLFLITIVIIILLIVGRIALTLLPLVLPIVIVFWILSHLTGRRR